MTGNTTTPGEKLRALFLAVLMVLSVFAGTVAFTGGAAANVSSVDPISTQETVGDEFTVTIDVDTTNGETVTVRNIVDGEVRETVSATDGGANDVDGGDTPEGTINVTLQAGKTYGGTSTVEVEDNSGNVTPVSYTTQNYLVELTEESQSVIQGSTQTIEGTIYEYPGDPVEQTMDYSVQYDPNVSAQASAPNETVLVSSDTGNGQFQTVRTFDEVDGESAENPAFQNDYPTDDATVGDDDGTPAGSAQPSYVVYVAENATGTDADGDGNFEPADYDNDGYAQIDTRLNVEGELEVDDTQVDQPAYKDTVDVVNGFISNADGGLGNYALRVEDPQGSTQKTTTSASDGSFGFTLEMDDAGTWNLGTNEGAFIGYQPITVQAQEADLEFSAAGANLATFEEEYTIQLNDSLDGFALNTTKSDDVSAGEGDVEGYINVTGPFLENYNDSNTPVINQDSVIAQEDPSDGVIDYIHVATDENGSASFNAVPTQGADVTATLELVDENSDVQSGLEQADDAADSPSQPDYTASENIPLGGADPVNVIDPQVEDPQTSNAADAGTDLGTYTDILSDSGSSVVEVLPLANSTTERIANGERFGNDVFQNLDGMTAYRVSFELRNQTNAEIVPGEETDDQFNHMEVNGAGLNATIYWDGSALAVDSRNDNVIDANYTDVDADGRTEYAFLVRPTNTDSADEQITHEITVWNNDPVWVNLSAAGLDISKFEVDGETVDTIRGDQTIDLTSVVRAPEDGNAYVNNGLVRLIQTGYSLDTETDARTANVNNGQYTFDNITLEPRGIDSDTTGSSAGIADEISRLVFTAYQYSDLNPQDNALERQEVDRAAVRTVEVAPNSTLQVEYLPEDTSKYSGFKPNPFGGETFTLTKGVEYDQIAFQLTTQGGEPVDLTAGIDNTTVSLNDLADAQIDGEPFVGIVGATQADNPGTHTVHFNETASNATAGYYVIDDIQNSTFVASSNSAVQADDTFAILDNGPVDDVNTFQLQITTPDASYTTDEASQGYFNAEEPSIDTEILGVNVNETTLDTYSVDHDTEDTFTSVSDVENMTVGVDRWYRVKGQVVDALGTPINGTMLANSQIQYVEDGAFSDAPDRADIYFVNGWDNSGAYRNNFGNGTATDNQAGINLNNESGYVLFDIKPTDADGDGSFTPQYSLFAHESAHSWTTFPQAYWDDTPTGNLPRVQVYDQSGAKLPVDDETGNQILANDVTQTLRVEAFPADSNDYPVPQLNFAINTSSDPVAENTINTLTNLEDSSVLVTDNDDYLNIPYEQGQVGYLTVTPTGTGDGIIALRSGSANGPITKTIAGEDIVFDVLRSNKQVDLVLSEDSITPGSTLNATVTRAATGEALALAGVSLEDTNGNVIETATTDENGVASIEIPESAQLGEYSIFTRPAGFQPVTTSFSVRSPAQLDEDLELFPQEGQAISGTSSADAGTNYTIEINGPGVIDSAEATVEDDGTFSATFNMSALNPGDEVTATIPGVDSVTYTIAEPPTATVDIRNQVSTSGDIVNVREVFLPEGGFLVIHNASTGEVIGHTAYFEPGTYDDVDVLLDSKLEGGPNQIIAMPHLDTNGNQQYEFGSVEGADGPYTSGGSAVTDAASVAVPTTPAPDTTTTTTEPPTTESTTTTTEPPADTSTTEGGDTGDGDGPGFGIAVALLALIAAALLAVRRNE